MVPQLTRPILDTIPTIDQILFMAKRQSFSEQLRRAIISCGTTRYEISKATGIPQSELSRFVHAKRGLSLANIDLICDFLEARLVTKPVRKKKGR